MPKKTTHLDNVKVETKKFKFKKGEEDFKVWSKPNKFIADYMTEKRRSAFTSIKTKRDIVVTIRIEERRTRR